MLKIFKNSKILKIFKTTIKVQSSDHYKNLQKFENQNSQKFVNKWCIFGHSAQKSNQDYRRSWSDDYYTSNQCYDLSVWSDREDWCDNRVCYNCENKGHIVINCRRKRFETRRCYDCQIKCHTARVCPMRSNRISLDKSHKKDKKDENARENPKERIVKLSKRQRNKLRKKRKRVREYLEKILSSGTAVESDNNSNESFSSPKKDQSSKTNCSSNKES
ncbi:putative transcription factor interactor and regulator CCHC(Zn) family [Helianthus anomalus]